jgi:hypothetical protein
VEATVAELVRGFCPHIAPAEIRAVIHGLLRDAYEYASAVFERKAALEWADGFKFPEDVFTRDEDLLAAASGDLAGMIREIQRVQSGNRFSRERVVRMVPADDPDYNYLLTLADGMRVEPPTAFVPREEPQPLRRLYVELAPAINKLLLQQWQLGRAIIVRTSVALTIPGRHFSPIHWTASRGKPQGRQLLDLSDGMGDNRSLNSQETKEWGWEHIGRIVNPAIERLIKMIWDHFHECVRVDPSLTWDKFTLCKMDLKSAFTLLNFAPEDVRYLAAALTDELTFLSHSGVFGYTNLPAYFDHISKVLLRLVRALIRGVADMFVDDKMFFTQLENLAHDQGIVAEVATGLLGPTAVAHDKTFVGQTQDWIGWEINLLSQTVTIAEHCYLKATHLFFAIDTESPVTVLQLEQLGSLASRYSLVCAALRPYTAALHAARRGAVRQNVRIPLTAMAKRSIWLWRCMLVMLRCERVTLSRSFESFVGVGEAKFLVVSDASLQGVGGEIFARAGSGWVPVGVLRATFPAAFSFDESAYQNLAEFIGILLMLVVLVERGVSDCAIQLRGDSTTALAWASSQKVKGEQRNNAAAVAFCALSLRYRIEVSGTEFINSEANFISDALSRGRPMAEYGEWYTDESNYYPWREGDAKSQLLAFCNPRREDDGSMRSYMESWGTLDLIFQQLDLEIATQRHHPITASPVVSTATNPPVS